MLLLQPSVSTTLADLVFLAHAEQQLALDPSLWLNKASYFVIVVS